MQVLIRHGKFLNLQVQGIQKAMVPTVWTAASSRLPANLKDPAANDRKQRTSFEANDAVFPGRIGALEEISIHELACGTSRGEKCAPREVCLVRPAT